MAKVISIDEKKIINNLKIQLIKIFKANSFIHLTKIFFIFGITGSLSLLVSEYLLIQINLDQLINSYIFFLITKLFVLLLIYQIILIVVAMIFGEFEYFSKFIKKFLTRMKVIK